MTSIQELVRPAFRDLPGGFVPFDTVDRVAARLGLPVDAVAKLDANENVYGPSPAAVAAVAQCRAWNLYPDASQLDARRALAAYVGVDEKHILLFNGGDELIGMLCHLFLSPNDNIVECAPSFEMYGWYARSYGATLRSAPRQEDQDYAISAAAIRAATDAHTKMILLCNPNNPTGTFTPVDEILPVLDFGVVVMVDEAYVEFCGETVAPLVARYDNLLVLRTMSKWAGLAGLRVGYAVASAAIAEQLWKVKDPFNVNAAGQMATAASVHDSAYLLANVRKIVLERQRLYQALGQFPFLRVYPSRANFLLCRVIQDSAHALRAHLERAGILVRLFDKPALPNAIRITVGTPEHTDRIAAALAQWRPQG
jgi:histidinol-phosphate aminotransferase